MRDEAQGGHCSFQHMHACMGGKLSLTPLIHDTRVLELLGKPRSQQTTRGSVTCPADLEGRNLKLAFQARYPRLFSSSWGMNFSAASPPYAGGAKTSWPRPMRGKLQTPQELRSCYMEEWCFPVQHLYRKSGDGPGVIHPFQAT